MGKSKFPRIDQLALDTEFLNIGAVVVNVLVEVSSENDGESLLLVSFHYGDQIISKVEFRGGVWSAFIDKSCLLLVIGA